MKTYKLGNSGESPKGGSGTGVVITRESMKKRRVIKQILIWSGLVAAIGGGVWAWVALRPKPVPDVNLADAGAITKYMASKDFAGQSDEQRGEFMKKVMDLPDDKRREVLRPDGLDDKTKQALRDNMRIAFQARMVEDARDFFKLSGEEQTAALDKRIDDMEARRKEFQDRRAAGGDTAGGNGGPGGPGGPGRGGNRNPDQMEKRMQERIEQTTPEDRAYTSAYFQALRARMQQRGIAGGGPGRRG